MVTTPEFIKEALRDAVQDFEQCLQRSKDDRLCLSTSTPKQSSNNKVLQRFDLIEDASKVSKFNTFPRSLSSPEDNGGQPKQGRYSMEIILA